MEVTCTVQPDGRLELTVDEETREELATHLDNGGRLFLLHGVSYWGLFADLFESHICNGGYHPFDAGDGNPFVGLTSAPCIAEEMASGEDGQNEIIGRFWYYADYMIRDPLQELAKVGRTLFDLA